MSQKTKEPQYQRQITLQKKYGLSQLGLTTNQIYRDDPRHLLFILSRYKFVAKMLSGYKKVLEIGCGDAFGTRLVLQETKTIHAIDFDPIFVKDVNDRMNSIWKFTCKTHDILLNSVDDIFDAAYALDVLEHISQNKEKIFFTNIVRSLHKHGILIIGTPSKQSQQYASTFSKQGHINCKDSKELKQLLLLFFHNVFIFSMNDEIVHTGFYPMAHYLFALATGIK